MKSHLLYPCIDLISTLSIQLAMGCGTVADESDMQQASVARAKALRNGTIEGSEPLLLLTSNLYGDCVRAIIDIGVGMQTQI